ncbi:MAG: hypothetical protein EBT57_06955 [Verrucomicrobia bacterium]|nr:hypothetical protein [Verrucomicrobiota bacterium]
MRPALFLVGWLSMSMGFAQAPIDLDSPFPKTALLQGVLGKTEEFEIQRVRVINENLEMTKLDGAVLLAPMGKVLAVLPKLPPDGFTFTQKDAQKTIEFLQKAQKVLPDRTETSARALRIWVELASKPSAFDQAVVSQKDRAVQQWLDQIQGEEGKPKPVDLAEYVREGERLRRESSVKSPEIERQLEKIRNLMAMDFREIRGKELPTDWTELVPVLPGILSIFLMLLGIWTLMNVGNLSSAIKAGVIRTSQKGGESQTTVNLKGLIYLVYAALGFTMLFFLLRPSYLPVPQEFSEESMGPTERAIYLSMNSFSRWSSQGKASVSLPAADVFAYLQTILPRKETRANEFVSFLGPEVGWNAGVVCWRQTIKLGFLPIRLDFQLLPSAQPFLLERPVLGGCWMGQIPLGEFIGRLLWGRMEAVTSSWDRSLGLQNGATWMWTQGETIQVRVPQVTGRKDEKKLSELGGREKAKFKEAVSAQELAQVFAQGDGEVYLHRTIQLTGRLKAVSSMHRLGNTPASESGATSSFPRGLEDEPDGFILETGVQGSGSLIQIKVLVKSPNVYFLDNRGDLYREGSSPNNAVPLVARQKNALFKGGRVERMERNVIEVYGAQPPEEAP